jgi:hypothetical protein
MDGRDFYSQSMTMRKETTWHRVLPFAAVLAILLGVVALGTWVGVPKSDSIGAADLSYSGP